MISVKLLNLLNCIYYRKYIKTHMPVLYVSQLINMHKEIPETELQSHVLLTMHRLYKFEFS